MSTQTRGDCVYCGREMTRGGLARLSIDTDICAAELYLHGAHLCQWQPRSQARWFAS